MKCPRHTTLSYLLYSMSPLTHLEEERKSFLKQFADYRHGITNIFHIREEKELIITRRQKKICLDFSLVM